MIANEQQLVLADMMTGRHNMLVRLLQVLPRDPDVCLFVLAPDEQLGARSGRMVPAGCARV